MIGRYSCGNASVWLKADSPVDGEGGSLESILSKVALLIGLLIGITVHECAHAWSANELGDSTARYQGRVTLNPLAHLDPLGSLLMLYSLLAGFGIGWGKPTPVNPFNLRYGPYFGLAITSVAGPISNILVAIVFAIPLRLGLPMPGELSLFILYVIVANISLAVFNLIPIPPLDGFSILRGILSQMPGVVLSGCAVVPAYRSPGAVTIHRDSASESDVAWSRYFRCCHGATVSATV
jgi:Zn-dependent protease